MSTKHIGAGFSPYDNPYDAFNNYMNVLSDFMVRVNAEFPETIENEELNSLLSTIKNPGKAVEELQKELDKTTKKTHTNTVTAKHQYHLTSRHTEQF